MKCFFLSKSGVWGLGFFPFFRGIREYLCGDFQSCMSSVDDSWVTAAGLWLSSEIVCVLTFLNSDLRCGVALCLLDSVYLHEQCVIRATVMFLFKISWVAEQRLGVWGCCEYLFTVNLQLTSVIKADSSSSLLEMDDYLVLSVLA